MSGSVEDLTTRALRGILLALFAFGALGVSVELLLLEHFEKLWQRLPLSLLLGSLVVLGWRALTRSRASLRAFQLTMIACVASGAIGIWLHYRGNMEFEVEMMPALGGLELIAKASHGAFPTLAPGTMIQLGLLGLAYTLRHPGLRQHNSEAAPGRGDE